MVLYEYGAPFLLFMLLATSIISNKIGDRVSKKIDKILIINLTLFFGIFLVLAICYLFYPSYIDHLEPSIATLGAVFNNGGEIYPNLDSYTYSGLLYGPALSEIQSIFQLMGLNYFFLTKLPGVLGFFTALVILFYLIKNNLARSYLLLMLPFSWILFWNKAEPFFLLLVALTLFLSQNKNRSINVFFCGVLAGLAICLKLHGVLYILAAILICPIGQRFKNISAYIYFSIGILVIVYALFAPAQVSVLYFAEYIKLASKHGLSRDILIENFSYLFVMSIPLIIIWIKTFRINGFLSFEILLLFAIEGLVSIIGGKIGSGIHHLLPFIPINAYAIEHFINKTENSHKSFMQFKIAILAFSLVVISLSSIKLTRFYINNYENYNGAMEDFLHLSKKYPNAVMGVADGTNYAYTFYRPFLASHGVMQIDYASYMDLNISGVTEDPLINAINQCKFAYIFVPIGGKPFAMINFYNNDLLFSNRVFSSFEKYYKKIEASKYYTVFNCVKDENINLKK